VPAIELTKFAMDPESKRCKLAGEAQEVVNTLHLNVSLPSGRSASLSLPHEGTVLDLKLAAQQSLGQALLRLAAPDGRLLDPKKHLQDSGLQDGDSITAVAQELKAAATESTVVLWCPGGGVVTWGRSDIGGDSARVRDQLKNVQQIHATRDAFAAILADGSVVTWGNRYHGGDSTMVRDQLRNVEQIHATNSAFAAILADGSVVTWGCSDRGGDSTVVRDQLKNVQQIHASDGAFAAILADGSAVTWGNPQFGGDSTRVRDQLKNVQQIHAAPKAFAAILTDGSVVTWGHPDSGGDSTSVTNHLRHL
jgi:alpha-tubulin suppressor-like RCC1 family protein